MPNIELYANYYQWTVTAGGGAASPGAIQTLTVSSTTGMPAASSTAGTYFHIVDIQDTNTPPEIMKITNVSGTTLTVVRGSEGASPWVHNTPWVAIPVVSALTMSFLQAPSLIGGAGSQARFLGQFPGVITTDTWRVGDFFTDGNNALIHLCVGNGTPGTWVDFPSNGAYTGVVQMYAGTSAPSGFLMCDGSAIARLTYANLFAVIGTAYGVGDGGSTFNLPNYNSANTFPRGGTPGGSGGVATHTHALSSNGYAQIAMAAVTGTNNIYMNRLATASSWNANLNNQTTLTFNSTGAPTGQTVGATLGGASDSGSTLPPYQQVNFIIKT